MNNKGFTMIELLAAIVILGLLMGYAIPTVVRVIDNNKLDTYLEDAKKLATAAEYKIKTSGGKVKMPSKDNCIVINMEYLQSSDFDAAPNGGDYNQLKSFVLVKRQNSTERKFLYYVRLVEEIDSSSFKGIDFSPYSDLSEENSRTLVTGMTTKPKDIYASTASEKTTLINYLKGITFKELSGDSKSIGASNKICNDISEVYYLE